MDPVCLLLPHATDGPLSLMAGFFVGAIGIMTVTTSDNRWQIDKGIGHH